MPHRSGRQILRPVLQHSVYEWITNQNTIMHEPAHERLRILIVRKLHSRTLQPEGSTRRFGQDRLYVQESPGGQVGHERAEPELDPEYLGAFGVVRISGRRPRSDEHHPRLAVLPHEDHVPMALGGTNRRIIAHGSTAYDRLHVRRVRPSFLVDDAHDSAPSANDYTVSPASNKVRIQSQVDGAVRELRGALLTTREELPDDVCLFHHRPAPIRGIGLHPHLLRA